MTKAEKTMVEVMATEMNGWKPIQWATFHRRFAAAETVAKRHALDHDAYKMHMVKAGKVLTDEAGGHYASLSTRKGASYVDYNELLAELREEGYDVEALVARHTKSRPDTVTFKFT